MNMKARSCGAEREQRALESFEAVARRNAWAERLAQIKTAELLRITRDKR